MIDEDQIEPFVEELLDGIPGAFERAQLALDEARRGEAVPLEALDALSLRAPDKS